MCTSNQIAFFLNGKKLIEIPMSKLTGEESINYTLALMWGDFERFAFGMSVKDIESRYEKLMGIMLLITRKILCMSPYEMKHSVWNVRNDLAPVKFL